MALEIMREENMISPDEINSIAYLNRKRKLQAGLLEVPSPKHVCWGQRLECEFSSDLKIDTKKLRSSIFSGGSESDPECVSHSYSFPGDANSSSMSSYASVEPSTSSTCWNGSCSQIGLCSSENIKISPSKSDSTSFCVELQYPHQDCGLLASDNYEDHLLEFGGHADVSFSEYQHDGTDNCENKDLEDLLYSNGIDAGNYVLSSGRRSVNQDDQEKTKSLTIDKEFEQYFSMLML